MLALVGSPPVILLATYIHFLFYSQRDLHNLDISPELKIPPLLTKTNREAGRQHLDCGNVGHD